MILEEITYVQYDSLLSFNYNIFLNNSKKTNEYNGIFLKNKL
jgi:hypothetical protein